MKKGLAKIFGYLGGLITALAGTTFLGKYQGAALIAGPALTSLGVHLASETSATNPTGAKQ